GREGMYRRRLHCSARPTSRRRAVERHRILRADQRKHQQVRQTLIVRLPWTQDDPYWDAFINRAPTDPNNSVPYAFRQVEPGGVNPVKTEVHSPNVMSAHVKDLARFYGADQVGIVQLGSSGKSAIVCTVHSDFDAR